MDFKTRYEFDPGRDLLGKGEFSKIYRARDVLLERTVALKFFTAKTPERHQFLNDIKKVIRFEHPNLCKYHDVAVLPAPNAPGQAEPTEVAIMEYLGAGDFKSYVRKHPEHTDKLLLDILKGLAYLHRHGIVHRDLRPKNILIQITDGMPVAKITDFGLRKFVGAGDHNESAFMGHIAYLAPEQFNPKKYGTGGRITTNLDLWSFGLLVYDALRDQPLFGSMADGAGAEQVMSQILGNAFLAQVETLPAKYRKIVKRCLVHHAAQRVQAAAELIPLLEPEPVDRLVTKPLHAAPAPSAAHIPEVKRVVRNPALETAPTVAVKSVPAARVPIQAQPAVLEAEAPEAALPQRRSSNRKRLLVAALAIGLVGSVIAFSLSGLAGKSGQRAAVVAAAAVHIPPMIRVEGGQFMMGSNRADAMENEQPAHTVFLSAFSIGKYEVTIEQFRQFVRESGYTTDAEREGWSLYYQNGKWTKPEEENHVNWRYDMAGNPLDSNVKDLPVVHVSWNDALQYCRWLSKKTGTLYTLPTEEQWEYAAYAGKAAEFFAYSGGNDLDEVGWYGGNSGNRLHPVGGKKANALGIHDLSGNVMEWCQDSYKAYGDEQEPGKDADKVLRGGAWFYNKDWCRATFRTKLPPGIRGGAIGFRVCTAQP